MSDHYWQYLHQSLLPSLSAIIEIVAEQQPGDPIDFIGHHMNHIKVQTDGSTQHPTSCDICKRHVLRRKSMSFPLNCVDLVDALRQTFSDHWLEPVGHWRKLKIVDAWSDLTRTFGDNLKWWHLAHCMQHKEQPAILPVLERKSWKTVRVFVSSTFRDMFCERDWLVKHVFPELRSWCAERKLYLVECDLRWGVPKDSNSREILAACLNEIDRCREENTMPYFVGLLGNRYGWVPEEDQFPQDMRSQYCWLPGMSVTSLEVFTGCFWDNNPQAILMFRDASVLCDVDKLAADNGVDAEKVLSGYREADDALATSLEHLKQIVRNNLPCEQIGDYSCELAGLSPDGAGNYRLNLTGLRSFGERVLEFLKKRIAMQFVSVSNESQSGLEIQHAEHEQFMEQRGAVLFGRSRETEQILAYVNQHVDVDKTVSALIVSGSAGTGKSSLMANVALACTQNPANKVVVHFVGATAGSTTLNRVITRLWYECLAVAEDKIPTDADELKRSLDVVLRRASQSAMENDNKRLVVLIDAVNQMDDEGDTLGLLWLPKQVPHNVRLIVSTLEGQTLDALRAAKLEELVVEPLTDESRKLIVTEFFRTYNKKLSDAQVEQLLRHGDAGRPLWLSLACEELRVFGTFELLDEKIASLAGDLLGLVQQVIERVVSEAAAGGDLMQAAFSLIRASRFGLVESELLELLVIEPTLPAGAKLDCVKSEREEFVANIEKLPMQIWAILYLTIRQFLRPVGSSGDGRLDFYHRSISKVVKAMMLSDKSVGDAWHRRIADYFDNKVVSYRRKAEELPYQLLELKDFEKLKQVLTDYLMFEQLYKEDTKMQLLMFWREIGGYKLAADMYLKAFTNSWPHQWFPGKISQNKTGLQKLWASSVGNFSSQYGAQKWSAERIIGGPTVFPNHGDFAGAWAPKSTGTADEYVELVYDHPLYIVAVCIVETYHAGGVKQISVKSEAGNWLPIYQATKIENICWSRKFIPEIQRPRFKSKEIRIEIDQSACNDWCEIDAVAVYGYDEYLEEGLRPEALIARDWPSDLADPNLNASGSDEIQPSFGSRENDLIALTDEELAKWCSYGLKLGWFLIDVGEFELGERHLGYVYNVATAKYAKKQSPPTEVAKKIAEISYVQIVLYRNWFTKFVHARNSESIKSREMGRKIAQECYKMHAELYSKDDIYFGEVVAACGFFIPDFRDEVIALFEAKNYTRGLVELYSLKGTQTQYDDITITRAYHDKAIKLAYSEFGKFHVKTARAHQLCGQMLWNRWTRFEEEKHMERMNELFLHYWTEYEIFDNIFGPEHPLTIRSRADNIIVLGQLGRDDEASELSKMQPKNVDMIGTH